MPYVVGGQFEQLPEWYRDILRSFMERTESLRKQEYPEYRAPRVAGVPEYMQKSYELAKGIGKHEPYYARSKELLEPSRLPYGQQLQQYMNPYMENVVERIGKKGRRILQEQIMPTLEAKFVGLGQHGSSRHKDLSLRAARDLEEAILEKQQEALASGFQHATGIHAHENLRNLESARTLGNLGLAAQTSSQQDINLLNSLGAQQQAHRQQELNEQQAEYWRRMMWPHQNLAQQASFLQGIPSPSQGKTTMEYTPPTAIPEVNTLGKIGSLASQLYAAKNMPQLREGGHLKKMPGLKTPSLSSLKFRKNNFNSKFPRQKRIV